MAVPTAALLTRQFYEWEQRGRGWAVVDSSCDLEPPFVPFFGHFLPESGIVDDGRRPHWLRTLFSPQPEQKVTEVLTTHYAKDDIAAYTFTDPNPVVIYTCSLPRHFKQSAERMEQLLVMLSYRKAFFSFEVIATPARITLQLTCRRQEASIMLTQLQAFFPDCVLQETCEDQIECLLQEARALYTVDYGLQEEFMRPLATYPNLEHDPYTPLFAVLNRLGEDENVILQVLFSGTQNPWAESIMTSVMDSQGKGSFFLDAPEMPQLAREKTSRPLFGVTIRAITFSAELEDAARLLERVSIALRHASTSPFNALTPLPSSTYPLEERLADILMRETSRVGMLLNSKELATFVHFPSSALHTHKLTGSNATTKAAPAQFVGHDYELGLNVHQGTETVVGIPPDQRLRHLHVMGATGTGKSTLLQSLIMQDVQQGNGLCVLDPHGDLVESILQMIPEHRSGDVVWINPGDTDFPVGLNILCAHSDLEKELLASDLVALFRRFSTSWGDQMNSVFANAIMAFVYNTQTYHLGDLRKFIIDLAFRTKVLETATDPEIPYYWQKEFPILKSGSIGPILTRLDAFLRPRVIRNMVCQTRSLDFQQLMDTKKIVLVKLSQGLLGAENSFLLGAFIVSKLQQTAMARQALQQQFRVPFYCYIDEFHHFITPSMASILSGARKYGLGLVLAHQDIQQVQKLDAEIAASLLSNAGTRVCFRLGDTDAKRLQEGFSSFGADDLQNLGTGEAILRVGTATSDFNLTVLPFEPEEEIINAEDVIDYSRCMYSVPVAPPAPSDTPNEAPAPVQAMQPEDEQEAPLSPPPPPEIPQPKEEEAVPKEEQLREHIYLQNFIKKLAEEYGYKAGTEVPTPDSNGQVDVLLEKEGTTIAVEISVTTTPEWELHNIQKCLLAGYTRIVVCSSSASKLKKIQRLVEAQLKPHEQQKVQLVTSDEFSSLLQPAAPQQPKETIIKGYRVKVKYEENADRQQLLKSVLNASKKTKI